jgi:tripartite-type tricarboxylate transporter receptor subunit TctC
VLVKLVDRRSTLVNCNLRSELISMFRKLGLIRKQLSKAGALTLCWHRMASAEREAVLFSRAIVVIVSACTYFAPVHSYAQNYPVKPIRFVTGGIGGSSDFTARVLVQEISSPLGQPIIVDNHPSGVIPGQLVSRAAPDGYTLLVASSLFWVGPLLQKTPYDVVRDFSPITITEISPSTVVVHPSLPVRSIKDLIALAKAKPGELNYGTTAIGSGSYLAGELFKSMAGVNIVRIMYSGSAAATISALLAGETQVQFGGGASMSHIKSGRLRALAVTSSQPSALFPDLPTVAASGLPGFEAVSITTVFAPARTPEAIIKRLNQEIVYALKKEDVKAKFFNSGVETVGSSPEQLAATVKVEMARWGKVIKDAGIKID